MVKLGLPLEIPNAHDLEEIFYFGKKGVQFLPKQWELCFAQEPEIAGVGGYGSAKTKAGIYRATRLLTWHPGNLGLIGRYASTDLAGTTRNDCNEFWEEANLLEDFVEKHRKYKVPTATVRCVEPYSQEIIPGKYSEALFVHFDDPTHIHGYHAGFAWIDEANECIKKAFEKAMSRLRRPGFEGLYSLWVTSNTDAGYDWIYDHFLNPEEIKKLTPSAIQSRRFIHSTTYDNRKNLPAGYIENMENTYSDKMRRVYLMGSYEAFEGQMYEEWAEETHVFNLRECFPAGIPKEWKRLLAIDPGGSDPWAWEFAAVDPEDNVILYDELYGPGNRAAPFAEKAKPKIRACPNWQAIVIDSENKQSAGELEEFGIHCTNAQKAHKTGDLNSSFHRLSGYLHPNPKHAHPSWHPKKGQPGSPRLFVADVCGNLRKEFPQQRWKVDLRTGKFLNVEAEHVPNHAVDCVLYIVRERPHPTKLEKSVIADLPADMSKMGKIMNFEKRQRQEEQRKALWDMHMGHGRRRVTRTAGRWH